MKPVAVYADGGLLTPCPSEVGGVWAYCWVAAGGEVLQTGVDVFTPDVVASPDVNSGQAEFLAILHAMRGLPDKWSGTVYSDAKYVLDWCRQGGNLRRIPQVLKDELRAIQQRLGQVAYINLRSHPTQTELKRGMGKDGRPVSIYNVLVDKMCLEMTQHYREICSTNPS